MKFTAVLSLLPLGACAIALEKGTVVEGNPGDAVTAGSPDTEQPRCVTDSLYNCGRGFSIHKHNVLCKCGLVPPCDLYTCNEGGKSVEMVCDQRTTLDSCYR